MTNLLDGIELGTGTWQWGDNIWWNYGGDHGENDVREAFRASLNAGINLFDTAEIYGQGKSERLIGANWALERERDPDAAARVMIATKFAPLPFRLFKSQFRAALAASLDRLRVKSVDLYQIHWTYPITPEERWADALADALDAGQIRAAGVSNYNREQTIRAHHTLTLRGHGLTSNQLEYHLLNRKIETDGTFEACRERGIRVIAYSPLAMGLLTGKYTVENPPPGLRGWRFRSLLKRVPPLIDLMRRIGEAHGGKSPSQVALNWVICKGALPIPGAKNARHVQSNAGAAGWRLTDDEVAALDEMSARVMKG